MTRMRLMPHDVASAESVEFGAWWIWLNGERTLVDDRLKGWDYESSTRLELQPAFDEDRLLESVGAPSLAALAILLLADCPATGERFVASHRIDELLRSDERSVLLDLPRGQVAELLKLSAHVVAATPFESARGRVRPGARLADSGVHTLRLEGEGARFPTEEVSFAGLGLEPAAWTLRCTFASLDESLLGSVRLLINSDHPAADSLLDAAAGDSALAQQFLRLDVARQLLVAAADLDPHFGVEWTEGSVGHALDGIAQLFLKADLPTVLRMVRSDPARFERRLQDGFDLMRAT